MYFPHRITSSKSCFRGRPTKAPTRRQLSSCSLVLMQTTLRISGTSTISRKSFRILRTVCGTGRKEGYHHPFRHPEYRGDGALYHKRFAEIGFTPEHAERVSFVELIDVPTSGRSNLKPNDLKPSHLDRLRDWVLDGRAAYIFIPPVVGRLLRRTPQFSWLPEKPISHDGSLPVLFRSDQKVVFAPFHFSCVGKNCLKKDRDLQIRDIGKLIR